MNYKIAIVGPKETIRGFSLLGVETVSALSTEEAIATLKEMKRNTSAPYAIIFITEDLAKGFSRDDEKYFAKDPLPAIIPLPSHLGTSEYSNVRLKRIVERAVGSDILK